MKNAALACHKNRHHIWHIFFVLLISFANLKSLYWKWCETYRSYGSMLLFHVNLYMRDEHTTRLYALERVR